MPSGADFLKVILSGCVSVFTLLCFPLSCLHFFCSTATSMQIQDSKSTEGTKAWFMRRKSWMCNAFKSLIG